MVPDRIRRVTRDGRWIPEIDGLRFIAITSVVLLHMFLELRYTSGRIIPVEGRYSGLFWLISNGGCGVSLFFVISGFVLALPFARHFLKGSEQVSLRKYFLRRVTRLEPPYLASVFMFVALVSVHAHRITADLLHHAAASAIYLHGLVYGTVTPVNTVSWSLEIEIQFYIAAPIFMQLFRVRGTVLRRVIMALLVLGISFAQMLIDPHQRLGLTVIYFGQFFLMGLLLADLYILDGERIQPSLIWDAAGFTGLILMFALKPTFANTHVIMPWLIAPLFLAALRGIVIRRVLANPWIATIGGMCYSIYLTHWQMIAVLFKVTRHGVVSHFDFLSNYAIQVLITAVPVLLIGLAFYLLIERPCMDPNWPSKLWHWVSGRSGGEAVALDSDGISA